MACRIIRSQCLCAIAGPLVERAAGEQRVEKEELAAELAVRKTEDVEDRNLLGEVGIRSQCLCAIAGPLAAKEWASDHTQCLCAIGGGQRDAS